MYNHKTSIPLLFFTKEHLFRHIRKAASSVPPEWSNNEWKPALLKQE